MRERSSSEGSPRRPRWRRGDLWQQDNGLWYGRGSISASFYETHPLPCTFAPVTDSCVLQHCASTVFPDHANAGLIYTWVDGSQEQSLSYNYTAGRYQTATSTIEPWDEGGLPLLLRANGRSEPFPTGVVPTFEADLTTPSLLTLTEPALDDTTDPDRVALVITRADGLELSWEGTSDGSVKVVISHQVSGNRNYATCRFDPSAGSATVPAAVLELLPTGSGSLWIDAVVEEIVEVDEWRVLTAGATRVVNASNRRPHTDVVLE